MKSARGQDQDRAALLPQPRGKKISRTSRARKSSSNGIPKVHTYLKFRPIRGTFGNEIRFRDFNAYARWGKSTQVSGTLITKIWSFSRFRKLKAINPDTDSDRTKQIIPRPSAGPESARNFRDLSRELRQRRRQRRRGH